MSLRPMRRLNPHYSTGKVVKGYGRGSKELGIPTANFPEDVVDKLPETMTTGIYFGFAQVNNGDVYKMVMSIGKNPFYNNEKKSMETHIMHKFEEDFYGQEMKIILLGYLRAEKNFNSLTDLIDAINNDIKNADMELENSEYLQYRNDEYFK